MSIDGPSLVLKVADDGQGLESPEEGNGLPGMRARAASLGGTLLIRSEPGKGTEVELRVPWRKLRETTWIGRVRLRAETGTVEHRACRNLLFGSVIIEDPPRDSGGTQDSDRLYRRL